jgi:uncharacterized LabA/DUF88 family protein
MSALAKVDHALAVLIDADNTSSSVLPGLLSEVSKFGIANLKRIYGDWTTPNLGPWKPLLLEHSIHPIQQFRYTVGKNSTDSAMIIDAMDLLHVGHLDAFCLVTSDSDFTRLAVRLRESGKRVYGFGEQKTPRPFVAACDRFIYTEVFSVGSAAFGPRKPLSAAELRNDPTLIKLLESAIEAASGESGAAHLGRVGHYLTVQAPDFDSRNYGFSKLSDLIRATGLFEVEKREQGLFVRADRK